MSVRVNVYMPKITRTPIKVGVRTYATYTNCGTQQLQVNQLQIFYSPTVFLTTDPYTTAFHSWIFQIFLQLVVLRLLFADLLVPNLIYDIITKNGSPQFCDSATELQFYSISLQHNKKVKTRRKFHSHHCFSLVNSFQSKIGTKHVKLGPKLLFILIFLYLMLYQFFQIFFIRKFEQNYHWLYDLVGNFCLPTAATKQGEQK